MQRPLSLGLGLLVGLALLLPPGPGEARVKLVALPEREATVIRMGDPEATLVEEARRLPVHPGLNEIDFSWRGVAIDPDSIRLQVLSSEPAVRLLHVRYPPNEDALIWGIHSDSAGTLRVRISYTLGSIDRLVAYRARLNPDETRMDLAAHLIIRNFSGEDFVEADVELTPETARTTTVRHQETQRVRLGDRRDQPIEKYLRFDTANRPWDPEAQTGNVAIPVIYAWDNTPSGDTATGLWPGKIRVYQRMANGRSLLTGEDRTDRVPVGEQLRMAVGTSRDVVVTQRRLESRRLNRRRNNANRIVLYDQEERIEARVENFKKDPVTLHLVEHFDGEWTMQEASHAYRREDHDTIVFELELPPGETRTVDFTYRLNHRRR
jgi:hypothetical protein